MARKLSSQQAAELESQGTTISGYIGGTKKSKYFTPDGREILSVPAMRTWIKKKDGKVVDSGTRDANLDRGWLLQPPIELKPHCPHCDNWHDTQGEIDACGAKKKAFDNKWAAKAKRMKGNEVGEVGELKAEVSELKSDMSDIKEMLIKLGGQIVSSK